MSYAGPAPHVWQGQRDRASGLVVWIALLVLVLALLGVLLWPASVSHDPVSERECTQTGGTYRVQPDGTPICSWPPRDL